jgi:hypothetical protein
MANFEASWFKETHNFRHDLIVFCLQASRILSVQVIDGTIPYKSFAIQDVDALTP